MTSTLYARSTRYGSNDEYVLEVSADRFGCIHILRDEDDPECDAEYMTLQPMQADAVATMLKGAAAAVRMERAKRIERDTAA